VTVCGACLASKQNETSSNVSATSLGHVTFPERYDVLNIRKITVLSFFPVSKPVTFTVLKFEDMFMTKICCKERLVFRKFSGNLVQQ
jgi:hypothetical protein